jgi:hypothetical protein
MLVSFLPAFLRVFVSLVVKVQRDFGVKADAKVVVHHTLLCIAVPENTAS